MLYRLVINKENEQIIFSEKNISNINIKSNFSKKNIRNVKVELDLEINDKIKKILKCKEIKEIYKLNNWSLNSLKKKDVYRELILEIIENNKVIRGIYFPKACISKYEEKYKDDFGNSKYFLCLEQRKEELEDIRIKFDYLVAHNEKSVKVENSIKAKFKDFLNKFIELFKFN